MATWEPTSYYYSGQGVVLIGERDEAGKPAGLVPVGNVSDLKIAVATSVVEHKEATTGQRGIDLRLTTETKATVSMTLENFNSANLAIALRGDVTNVVAGAATDEDGTVYLGKVLPLAHMKVSSVVVEAGATTLTPWSTSTADGEWDYKVNAEAGSIMWATNPDAAIEDGDAVAISYSYEAQNEVDALVGASTDRFMRFEGLNTADENRPVVIEVFRFVADPLKELALIGDTVGQFVLEGNALADNLRTSGSKYFRAVHVR